MNNEDTFMSHLVELRDRLLRAILAFLVIFVCLFPWAREIYSVFAQPMLAALPQGGQMIATDVVGVFLVPLKVSALVAFVIALPYILFQAWAFVAPGLYEHEKRLVLPLITTSTLLFAGGMAFAYFVVFPFLFKIMATFAPDGVAWMTDIEKYFSFALAMFLVFGITFETPVAVVLIVRMGFVTVEKLVEIRPYVIVGSFVVAAIVTPPDVVSQLLLAIPLCLLYEVGIIASRFVGSPSKSDDSDYKAMSDAQMERELDRIEAQQRKKD
jgi:sec-independent protein translocase protein TatC